MSQPRARPEVYNDVDAREVARPPPRGGFILPDDLQRHCVSTDCWVSVYGRVYDLSPLLALNRNQLAVPLIENAGSDISHWFCPDTMQPQAVARVRSDTTEVYKHPNTPFLHVPGSGCTGTPWWRDARYIVGELAQSVAPVYFLNTLTGQKTALHIPIDKPLKLVLDQQLKGANSHAEAYTWSCRGRAVDLDKSLTQNDIHIVSDSDDVPCDPAQRPPPPTILLHFEDDLLAI
ncbi:cytochrome b5 domain-containing protein [Cyclospora cayetanensis]|uniref:Cytochrome b5 domain-containing protein 1 n=1 Tax=Cyclospora cayetanensis TaxID=88456 RepID=A0A1D3CRI0_9EIME|nr:cytochrome b5 domain-containing protein [Cyclospora cayetanensis]